MSQTLWFWVMQDSKRSGTKSMPGITAECLGDFHFRTENYILARRNSALHELNQPAPIPWIYIQVARSATGDVRSRSLQGMNTQYFGSVDGTIDCRHPVACNAKPHPFILSLHLLLWTLQFIRTQRGMVSVKIRQSRRIKIDEDQRLLRRVPLAFSQQKVLVFISFGQSSLRVLADRHPRK